MTALLYLGNKMVEKAIEEILESMDCSLEDPNFKDTPQRVSRAYKELVLPRKVITEEIGKILLKTFPSTYSSIVLASNIITYSLCPHHLLPVEYETDIAYIPDKKGVLGLSKLERIADLLGRQPILQESLTEAIAFTIKKGIQPEPLGVAVIMKGVHMCMRMRGVESKRSVITTSCLIGVFKEHPETRQELFELIKHSRR
jgi:GTP cyclohydrolase I